MQPGAEVLQMGFLIEAGKCCVWSQASSGGSGSILPQEILKNSEVASGDFWGPKQAGYYCLLPGWRVVDGCCAKILERGDIPGLPI